MADRRLFDQFDPFAELALLRREFNELFRPHRWLPEWASLTRALPPINIVGAGDEILVTAELPGVKMEDLELSITGETLTLKGRRQEAEGGEGATYYRRERESGAFGRTIRLPAPVQGAEAQASYSNGVLKVRIPKAEEAKPRRISISAK